MPKVLDQLRDANRVHHYSYRNEQSYVLWTKDYILFHNKRHPLEMTEKEGGEYLTYLVFRAVSSYPYSVYAHHFLIARLVQSQ